MVCFFGGGRDLNPGPCIYYVLSELSSRGHNMVCLDTTIQNGFFVIKLFQSFDIYFLPPLIFFKKVALNSFSSFEVFFFFKFI